MEKPTKILISGVILAAIVASGGMANTKRLESKLYGLQEECLKIQTEFSDLGALCSEENLIRKWGTSFIDEMLKVFPRESLQLRIVQTEHAIRNSEKWWPPLGSLILLLSALPWGWYFLLRRIRELRDAIVGKQDA